MIKAIFYKEWIKTRQYLLLALLVSLGFSAYAMLRISRVCSLKGAEHLWVVERDSYAVRRTEIPSFIPEEQSVLIIGNMFDWTVKVNRGTEECYYAISAQDYTLIDSMAYQTPRHAIPGLSFTSTKDKFVKPRIVR